MPEANDNKLFPVDSGNFLDVRREPRRLSAESLNRFDRCILSPLFRQQNEGCLLNSATQARQEILEKSSP